MGIMIVAFAPDPGVATACGALPSDIRNYATTDVPGRTKTPRTTIPLYYLPESQLGSGRRARPVGGPPGAPVVRPSGGTVDVGDLFFSPANLVVKRGATVRWRFVGAALHNVTVAQGPRGFASYDLDRARTYSQKLDRPGTYRLFCALHPTTMLETVKVK